MEILPIANTLAAATLMLFSSPILFYNSACVLPQDLILREKRYLTAGIRPGCKSGSVGHFPDLNPITKSILSPATDPEITGMNKRYFVTLLRGNQDRRTLYAADQRVAVQVPVETPASPTAVPLKLLSLIFVPSYFARPEKLNSKLMELPEYVHVPALPRLLLPST